MMKYRGKISPQRIIIELFIAVFILLIVFISVGPIFWVFISSFKTNAEIFSSTLGFPKQMAFENYAKALDVAPILSFYRNSVVVSISATILNVFFLSMAAYVLTRFKFRGSGGIQLLLTSSLFIPGSALIMPVYITMTTLKLQDTLTSLIITYAAFSIPVSLYVLSSFIKTIPKEIDEAAYIDGSGFYGTFFHIVFPLIKPAMSTCAILAFLGAWNEFQYALILITSTPKRTLPIALKYFTSQFSSSYGQMFAATIIVVLPSIIVYILLQKQITVGLVSGAVKG